METMLIYIGAYKQALDIVGTTHLDIDVEAPIDNNKVNAALAQVQRERPDVTVSYTLMVQGDDYGITPELGVKVSQLDNKISS
jgi:chitinase